MTYERQEWWQHGKLQEFVSECEAFQSRLNEPVKHKQQSDPFFSRLMLKEQIKERPLKL